MTETGITDRLKEYVPWWGKILSKLVLSRMPVRYQGWERLGVFQHGRMKTPEYAVSVFRRHFDRADFSKKNGAFISLELGPGDSVASAIIARLFGAEACYLVDSGNFATTDMKSYREIIASLRESGLEPQEIPQEATLASVLRQFGGIYLTDGLESLKSIPDSSVDFMWSHAVLEHVRLKDFDETLRETRRIIRAGGVCSHRIDFRDHLAGSLNNLRFSESVWEADWMATSGFYTNRIQFTEMVKRFEKANFNVHIIQKDCWKSLPVARSRLDERFASIDEDELLVKGCDIVLKPGAE